MKHPLRFLIVNGPNINFLGIREPEIYGHKTYADLVSETTEYAASFGIETEYIQSNHEGVLIDEIQKAYGKKDGIILNPAGYTHTSIALADALASVGIPTVEVHISEIEKREDFRQISYVRPRCIACVTGRGIAGYRDAIDLLFQYIGENPS